jgi:hypothetical protein
MSRAIDVINELKGFTSRQAATVTRRATMNLRNATPRKSGFAAASWIPGLGSVSGSAGSPSGVSFAAQNAGMREVLNYRITRTPAPRIVNSTDYIEILNSGSSTQAPAGFIEEAISAAIRQTAGARSS